MTRLEELLRNFLDVNDFELDGVLFRTHVPHVAPKAYLHILYPAVNHELQRSLVDPMGLPDQIRSFYRSYNGAKLFSSALSILGFISPGFNVDRRDWRTVPPHSILDVNARHTDDPVSSPIVIFGKYSFDGSLLFIDKTTGRVFCSIGENVDSVRKEWDSFFAWETQEILRISGCFDNAGQLTTENSAIVPVTDASSGALKYSVWDGVSMPRSSSVSGKHSPRFRRGDGKTTNSNVNPPNRVAMESIPSLAERTVQIGHNGLSLNGKNEIYNLQVGYSVASDGSSLLGINNGDWRKDWVVIGSDTLCGDPVFLDTSDSRLPVYTARHGERVWSPELICNSYATFLDILEKLEELAETRSSPADLKSTPITQPEFDEFMRFVIAAGEQDNKSFWEDLILEQDDEM